MKKYLFINFLIVLIISLFLNSYYSINDLIFVLDPDNYDILEFVSGDNNLAYEVFFIIVSLFLASFIFLKIYINRLLIKLQKCQQLNFTNKLQIRSPPY